MFGGMGRGRQNCTGAITAHIEHTHAKHFTRLSWVSNVIVGTFWAQATRHIGHTHA